MSTEPRQSLTQPSLAPRLLRWTFQTALHCVLWLVLSGRFEVEFLAVGLAAAIAATAASNWLFHGIHNPLFEGASRSPGWIVRVAFRLVLYVPWLIREIVVSNWRVAYLVLRPRVLLEPSLVEFETTLRSERAQVLLAQSITLTPGTVTVDATGDRFVVHCLSAQSREGLAEGIIQRKVADVFEEFAPDHVTLREITSVSELKR